MTALPTPPKSRTRQAFTLVEVILAIVIALGILVVLLFFYQQASNLRTQALEETERLATARLVMDRLTTELRSIRPDSSIGPGFVGRSNSLQFIKADLPSFAAWTGGALGRSAAPVTDLKRVTYQLESPDGTNIAGLLRSEEPMVLTRQLSMSQDVTLATNSLANANLPPVFEEIRFLQFRYWGGTNWADSWNSLDPPAGIEVSLSASPLTNGMELTDLSGEIFRRVIYLGENGTLENHSLSTNATGDLFPEDVP